MSRFRYTNFSATPGLGMDAAGGIVEAYAQLPGGTSRTVNVANAAATDILSFPNLHGDIIVTTDGTGTRRGSPANYTAYGRASSAEDTTAGDADRGWLGQNGILTDHTAGAVPVSDMGARPYRADLGRFLSLDPVEGGCANKLVYVFGDPVNKTDLTGKDTSCAQGILWVAVGFLTFIGGALLLEVTTAGVGVPALAVIAMLGGLGTMTAGGLQANDNCARGYEKR